MNEIDLTKNASIVLKRIYSRYKQRVKKGMSKSEATDFDSSKTIHTDLLPEWTFEDVDSACEELLNKDFLDGFRADGYVYRAYLSDAGITFSQGQGSKSVSSFFGRVLELLQAIRSLLPW